MKKLFLSILGFVFLMLTGCSSRCGVSFSIISHDLKASYYVDGSLLFLEDIKMFESSFPNYQQIEEFQRINTDTFLEYDLIYFEYLSSPGVEKGDLLLKDINVKNHILSFEIYTSGGGNDGMVRQQMYYLLQVEKNVISRDILYQVNIYVMNENNKINETSLGFQEMSLQETLLEYEDNSFIVMKNLEEFSRYFSNYPFTEDIVVSDQTFKEYILIYFELLNSTNNMKIKKVIRENKDVFFEIAETKEEVDEATLLSKPFLIKLSKKAMENSEEYKAYKIL